MSDHKALVKNHIEQLLARAKEQDIPSDLIGRELMNQVIEIYRLERSNEDIAQELQFVADNLDPDTEFTFMRP